MHAQADGWHEVETDLVKPSSPYLYRLADGSEIADPASHAQLADVEGPSIVTDHESYAWRNTGWKGRPWEDAVIYELHIGTFTPQGTFRAGIEHLPHLRDIGITAIEIMPVAHFSGRRGWGYDGVLHYAPHPAYGTPDDLKALVDAAHDHGIMVLLDVVYNHFGPVGNMLHRIAPPSSTPNATRPGARHSPSNGSRYGAISSTTRCTGCSTIASTVCASTPPRRSSMKATIMCCSKWPPPSGGP